MSPAFAFALGVLVGLIMAAYFAAYVRSTRRDTRRREMSLRHLDETEMRLRRSMIERARR